ncbi:hypothetical protein AN639_09170 [Candidatus Epulonipiscium fishelsonii]|uniref:Uncharacterized protein n=1 Tax=Candidatus Epulonipiscium fishelsonii TaxID=77094 RepID=A0ACC8XDW3_9FIRM|nr:hypothetical protein AN639_09170 [Epulopiscium sp. SCG-B05WGA-EpuloA1]ONI41017.1 hypothetical protein AN396_04455 [Epulopiscium sp. SCG-B11WGA-EpuloA1]ONI47407.1 hypothetical protein AN644_00130 [Epulopiscium sp. SCG-C06WGA-EpuloA1]
MVIIFILMFGAIVLVHEWGHFITAKKFGVQVNEFSIGMGWKVWGKFHDGTLYTIRLLPIGGFCAMEGENEESNNPKSLSSKSPLQRIVVFAAGAFMNFLLAWLLFSIVIGYSGYGGNTIKSVIENSPIANAGAIAGETIIAIDGKEIKTRNDVSKIVTDGDIVYGVSIRGLDGNVRVVPIKPQPKEGGGVALGFYAVTEKGNVFECITLGFSETISWVDKTIEGFFLIITGQVHLKDMMGIVGVGQVSAQVWNEGMKYSYLAAIMNTCQLAALLSVNLAVLNLLPLPALDGGRIFFTLIEIVRGKPLDQEKEGYFHVVGFVFLMGLMIVIFFNDIARLMG